MTETSAQDTEQRSGDRFKGEWKAEQNVQPIISQPSLRVFGKYDTGMRTGGAELREKVPQGINPAILMLDLVDTPDGPGGIIDVEGRFNADKGQYSSVTVIDAHGGSITIEVEEIQ